MELDECKENSVNQFYTLKEIANSVATYFDFILYFAFLIMKFEINTSVILSTKFCIIGLLYLKGHINNITMQIMGSRICNKEWELKKETKVNAEVL